MVRGRVKWFWWWSIVSSLFGGIPNTSVASSRTCRCRACALVRSVRYVRMYGGTFVLTDRFRLESQAGYGGLYMRTRRTSYNTHARAMPDICSTSTLKPHISLFVSKEATRHDCLRSNRRQTQEATQSGDNGEFYASARNDTLFKAIAGISPIPAGCSFVEEKSVESSMSASQMGLINTD